MIFSRRNCDITNSAFSVLSRVSVLYSLQAHAKWLHNSCNVHFRPLWCKLEFKSLHCDYYWPVSAERGARHGSLPFFFLFKETLLTLGDVTGQLQNWLLTHIPKKSKWATPNKQCFLHHFNCWGTHPMGAWLTRWWDANVGMTGQSMVRELGLLKNKLD